MAALTTLMTRFCAGEDSWLVATSHPKTQAIQTPGIATASHDEIDTSVAIMATTPKTRQSMPDSEALNPDSGKSHLKETVRAHPA